MTTVTVPPLPARVAAVLATATTWTPARRKSDGKKFFFVPSVSSDAVYMTATDGCTCPGAQVSRTGDCKHQAAVRQHSVTAKPSPQRTATTHRPCLRKACGAILPPEWPYQFCDHCQERQWAILDSMAG